MIGGIAAIIFQLAIMYFAVVGIKYTFSKPGNSQGVVFIRDFFKYLALFIAVLFTCYGLSGILKFALNFGHDQYLSRIELARWISYAVIGTPVVSVISIWIRKEFLKHPEAKYLPAWNLYLLVASSASLLLWFLPLQRAILPIAGASYSPRSTSQALVAIAVWGVHMVLIRGTRDVLVNAHRFVGWFLALASLTISLISLLSAAISSLMDFEIGRYHNAKAIILAVTAIPLVFYYLRDFGVNANAIETRAWRILGGLVVPAFFWTIAATFVINNVLVWNFGETPQSFDDFFREIPSTLSSVLILACVLMIFKYYTQETSRDDITRLYQYVLAGSALTAASIGFGAIISGFFAEWHRANTIIFGLSLMATTFTHWMYQWIKIQSANRVFRLSEEFSPIRKIYLYIFVGAPSVVAIGATVWLTFGALKALLVGNQHLADSRFAIAAVVTSGLVGSYHFSLLRNQAEVVS